MEAATCPIEHKQVREAYLQRKPDTEWIPFIADGHILRGQLTEYKEEISEERTYIEYIFAFQMDREL